MWIFLPDSFLSIVADKDDPTGDRLLVRARRKGDIESVFPDSRVIALAGSDYAFRAWVPRSEVTQVIASQVESIDYSNFKNSMIDNNYHDAALSVWSVMWGLQHKSG